MTRSFLASLIGALVITAVVAKPTENVRSTYTPPRYTFRRPSQVQKETTIFIDGVCMYHNVEQDPVDGESVSMDGVIEKVMEYSEKHHGRPDIPVSSLVNDTLDELEEELGIGLLKRRKRAVTGSNNSWQKGIIPYIFTSAITSEMELELISAQRLVTKYTCIKFVPWVAGETKTEYGLDHEGHLNFVDGPGCYSFIGNLKWANGQDISGCGRVDCVHEIGHAAGLLHEHEGPYRDSWIRINWDHIIPGYEYLYYKRRPTSARTYGYYDLTSNMHYQTWAFSQNGNTYTSLYPELRYSDNTYYDMAEMSKFQDCRVPCHQYCGPSQSLPLPSMALTVALFVIFFSDKYNTGKVHNITGTDHLEQGLKCPDYQGDCENDGYVAVVDDSCSCRCPYGLDGAHRCKATITQDISPATWPGGGYGLPATIEGCPSPEFLTGEINMYSQGLSSVSSTFNLKGNHEGATTNMHFCMMENTNGSIIWPDGSYCIYRKGSCPPDFEGGTILFDNFLQNDETNTRDGSIPDGVYSSDTLIDFCCRGGGFKTDPIDLPNTAPFALFLYGSTCQPVRGMFYTEESFIFDNTDSSTVAATSGKVPKVDVTSTGNYEIHFCYYKPTEMNCGGYIELNSNNPSAVITSPNYPNEYGNGVECNWVIVGEINSTILINFDHFDIESGENDCLDVLEIRKFLLGQRPATYCGTGFSNSIRTIRNKAGLTFKSDLIGNRTGFSLTATMIAPSDLCYTGKGRNYRGEVNFTRSMDSCLPWKDVVQYNCHYHPFDARYFNDGLDGNACRNPGGDADMPWCYTGYSDRDGCVRDFCDACRFENLYDIFPNCSNLQVSGPFCEEDPDALKGCAKTCAPWLPQIPTPPKASEVTCDPPEIPSDSNQASALKSSYGVGEIVSITCTATGTTIEAECLSNGKWNMDSYACGLCPPGTFVYGDNCYNFVEEYLNYNDAKTYCAGIGGVVAYPSDKAEERFLYTLRGYQPEVWGGASDEMNEGDWVQQDNSGITYTNWYPGEPSARPYEDCVRVLNGYRNSQMTDSYCGSSYQFHCRIPRDERTLCVDRQSYCPFLFESYPSICRDFPDFARSQCPKTCGDCEGTTCTVPPLTEGAETSSSAVTLTTGDYIAYSCKKTYALLNGNLKRGCKHDGTLTGAEPTCLPGSCPSGWFDLERDATCYKFIGESLDYFDAQTYCRKRGTTLAVPKDEVIFDWITKITPDSAQIWLGADDLDEEGIWRWADDDNVTWTNWIIGEPTKRGEEDCIRVLSEYEGRFWSDGSCYSLHNFVCAREYVPTRCAKPTTGIGVISSYMGDVYVEESITYSCGPGFVYMSGDLTRTCGVDALLTGEDLVCELGVCPNGWSEYQVGCYRYFSEKMTYAEAQAHCAKFEGHIAFPRDEGSHDFIVSKRGSDEAVWLGGDDRATPNTWLWNNGEGFTWTNWEAGEPSNLTTEECGIIQADAAGNTWADVSCDETYAVLCKGAHTVSMTCPLPTVGANVRMVSSYPGGVVDLWQDVEYECEQYYVNTRGDLKRTCSSSGSLGGEEPFCSFGECMEGWTDYNGHCYKHFHQYMTYSAAKDHCANFNGDIALTKDSDTFNAAIINLRQPSDAQVWLGIEYIDGRLKWKDGTELNFTNWLPGEPSGSWNEHCARVIGNGLWADKYCEAKYSVVCESPQIGKTCSEPALGNGVEHDVEEGVIYVGEVINYNCKPRFVRYSGSLQRTCGADGQLTGQELECRHASCASGWSEYGDFCYQYFPLYMNYSTAQTYCESMEGEIATPRDGGSHVFVSNLRDPFTAVWLGADDKEDSGNWIWAGGRRMTWSNWFPGEPSNKSYEQCSRILQDSSESLWADNSCFEPLKFVCKSAFAVATTCDISTLGEGVEIVSGVSGQTMYATDIITYRCGPGYAYVGGDVQEECLLNGTIVGGQPSCKEAECEPGWTMYTYGCYKFDNTYLDYAGAKAHCEAYGGTIALPEDQATNDFIVSLRATDVQVWLGADTIGTNGNWMSNGKEVTWFKWAANEPTATDNDHCARLGPGIGHWFDNPCNQSYAVVCTVPVSPKTCAIPAEQAEIVKVSTHPGGLVYVGDVISFECAPSYAETEGNQHRTCLTDKTLTGTQLVCKPGKCAADATEYDQVCYRFHAVSKTYDEAVAYCANLQQRIALPRDEDFNTLMSNLRINGAQTWLGMNDRLIPKQWVGNDGIAVEYFKWFPGEPSNVQGEDCARMLANSEWADKVCSARYAVVCTDNVVAKTCSIPTAVQNAEYITLPTAPVHVGGEISYQCQQTYVFTKGNLTRTCTDEEVFSGTEPTCSIGKCASTHENDNTCYQFFPVALSHSAAVAFCVDQGGEIANPKDAAANAVISAARNQHMADIWIGGTDSAQEGTWVWNDGDEMTWSNWFTGEPSNLAGEDCARMLTDGRWADKACSSPYAVVCSVPYEAVTCPIPTSLNEGVEIVSVHTGQTVYANEVITYGCISGFVYLSGNLTQECLPDGTLGGVQLTCASLMIACTIPAIEGVVVTSTHPEGTVDVGDNIAYECESTYVLIEGNLDRTCLVGNRFSGTDPVCKPGKCASTHENDNTCYQFFPVSLSHSAAVAFCVDQGGEIANPKDAAANAVISAARNPHMADVWIGSTDSAQEGTWVWNDGDEMTWSNWFTGEPSNFAGEDCARMLTDGRWADKACSSPYAVVCSVPYEAITCPIPTSLNEGMEIVSVHTGQTVYANEVITYGCTSGYVYLSGNLTQECLTDGTFGGVELNCASLTMPCNIPVIERVVVTSTHPEGTVDVGDNIAYECESTYVLTEGNLDRTCLVGDRYSGTDPVCKPGNCGSATMHEQKCYKFHDVSLTYEEAETYCADRNGKIAAPKDVEDNDFFSNLRKNDETQTWLGIRDDTPNIWKTVDNENVTWFNWFEGEPSNTVAELCARMYRGGKWYDKECTARYAVICTAPFVATTCDIPTTLNTGVEIVSSHTGTTVYATESITYSCKTGYTYVTGDQTQICQTSGTLSGGQPTCSEGNMDECFANTDNCDANAVCTNTPTSFTCTCNDGFTGDGVTCSDIDECSTNSHNCHGDALCANTVGSFTCTCNAGFTGNGVSCSDIDECGTNKDNCHGDALCTNTAGSFNCTCNEGFTGSGVTCSDKDECTDDTNNCDTNAGCENTHGSFTCTCNAGYTGSGSSCTDIDECATGADNCDANAACINTDASFDCTCNTEYSGNGTTCTAIPCTIPVIEGVVVTSTHPEGTVDVGDNIMYECESTYVLTEGNLDRTCLVGNRYSGTDAECKPGNCGSATMHEQKCYKFHDVSLTYEEAETYCADRAGKIAAPKDVEDNDFFSNLRKNDETQTWLGIRDDTPNIWKTVDNEIVTWFNWFEGEPSNTVAELCARMYRGGKWYDKECTARYAVICTAPFVATTCDIPATLNTGVEIISSHTGTTVYATESITYGCKTGYTYVSGDQTQTCQTSGTLSGGQPTCTEGNMDECFADTDNCDANAMCTNTPTSFTCTCNDGFTGDGVTCSDIDECATNIDNCHENALCIDTDGSFTCTCNGGFTGDGVTCSDIDECATNIDNCHENAVCIDTDGSFTCTCNGGFTGDGVTCSDIDECATNNDNCHENALCTDTDGSFTCTCNGGFTGDGVTCSDIDECATNIDNCHENAVCIDTDGSFTCTCNGGFTGDGVSCSDIDECATNIDNCHENALCTDTDGSFTCTCNGGFTGDGVTCSDIDECATNNDNCHENALCTDTDGSFTCTCNGGFTGDGVSCSGIPCTVPEIEGTEVISNHPEGTVDVGDVITYQCPLTYVLKEGDLQRTCLVGDTFSGTEPVCIPGNCGSATMHEQKCYKFHDVSLTYEQAKTYCADRNGKIAVPKDDGDNTFLSGLRTSDTKQTWLGMQDIVPTDWRGPDNEEITWFNWAQNEPSNSFNEKCARMFYNGKWYDKECTARYAVICTAPFVAATCDIPTALNTGVEIVSSHTGTTVYATETITYSCKTGYTYVSGDQTQTCQTSGTLSGTQPVCTDGCTLPVIEGVRIISVHTDTGGIVNVNRGIWQECEPGYSHISGDLQQTCQGNNVYSGSQPVCKPGNCGDGTVHEGKCYQYHGVQMTYAQAETYCADRAGKIAMPKDEEDNNFLYDLRTQEIWLGMTNFISTVWILNDGSILLDWNKWDEGQPGTSSTEICAGMGDNKQWQRRACSSTFAVVCTAPVIATTCEKPQTLNNGVEIVQNETEETLYVGDIITYRCAAGYTLESGDLTQTCQINGTLSGNQPVCT